MAEKPAQAVVGWEQMGSVPPFTSHDPATEGWARRRNDPRVVERMAHLRERSGIAGLEVVAPDDVEAAARLFLRDGFVVVRDVMSAAQLSRVQVASTKLVGERVAETPNGVTYAQDGSVIRQPGRYSFGSHGNLHRPEWCMLADLPAVHAILERICQSRDYMVWGAGGDFCLPGTIEYQSLHRDLGGQIGDFWDSTARLQVWDLPPFAVTCNFPMVGERHHNVAFPAVPIACGDQGLLSRSVLMLFVATDFDSQNGPIRQIPGTQNSREPPPSPADEPEVSAHQPTLNLHP
jgi:hypothetical protein